MTRRAGSCWLTSEPFNFTADQLLYPRMTISELPEEVLLEMFSFYLGHRPDDEHAWYELVHVCRRWRCLVFASPHRLRLRLVCTDKRPVKEALDLWPDLPISICAHDFKPTRIQTLETNVIAALEHHDRVCDIILGAYPTSLMKILSTMKKPFPSLINLEIVSLLRKKSMIPDSFLGGSAPLLQSIQFLNIPLSCPEIRKLLFSAPNLVSLCLFLVPRSGPGCTSPEAMVNGLSVLTRLKSLRLSFSLQTPPPQLQQASGHRLPFTRVVLPVLTDIDFCGDKEYLEDIVSRIDTPLLVNITITFPHGSIPVTPPLRDFISRTEEFGACSKIDTDSSTGSDRTKIKFFRRDGEEL